MTMKNFTIDVFKSLETSTLLFILTSLNIFISVFFPNLVEDNILSTSNRIKFNFADENQYKQMKAKMINKISYILISGDVIIYLIFSLT